MKHDTDNLIRSCILQEQSMVFIHHDTGIIMMPALWACKVVTKDATWSANLRLFRWDPLYYGLDLRQNASKPKKQN